METSKDEEKVVLPHHEQQELCKTRLAYRQGRKLTAVKTYTIADESNHLLIFNVPSLNLRKEAKNLFQRFGKILQFTISTIHPAETFTETYHCIFERIQSARTAKKILDTHNFYGESLHICYAPEFESINETRQKLLQRKVEVTNRLRNLSNETKPVKKEDLINNSDTNTNNNKKKLNMGEINTISIGKQIREVVYKNKKRKADNIATNINKYKPNYNTNNTSLSESNTQDISINNMTTDLKEPIKYIESKPISYPSRSIENPIKNNEVIDCTSTNMEVITNIHETLNYSRFGDEIIKKVDLKPLNRIKFNIKK